MAVGQASARLPELNSGPRHLQDNTSRQLHPKRTIPREIQPLTGLKKRKVSHSPTESELAVPPITQLKSQGSSSDQSASHWFESANHHVAQAAHGASGYDNEPPFFVSHQHNYLPNNFATSEGSRPFGLQSRLDSENEELRGVIDDLTIENRRLKHVLRDNQRSQRNSPSTDNQDKLFEVRMHGLSAEKRRELEFLLKNFATSVHTSAPTHANSSATSGISASSYAAKNSSGRAKTDSGYASNSNSGQPSTLPGYTTRATHGTSQTATDRSIKKYLHDIPDTLMPRQQPIVMSERAKMALVVRRLEQLFTGRIAAPGEHSQPLQQQEVSQMAARADAVNSKKRNAEGSREAHILPPDSKVNFDNLEATTEKKKISPLKTSDSDSSVYEDSGSNVTRPGSPDQRPTRPLDLDIHRAQVAEENIQYIRHLGLSSPHLDAEISDDSWMYLNLLINMAQLHTINVTPEFIRRSIKKLSTKFELSRDGYKVRWIGGPDGTIFSKEEEKALETADHKETNSAEESNEDTGTGSSSKRSKTDSTSNAMMSNSASEDVTSRQQTSSGSKQQISTVATSNLQSSNQTKQSRVESTFDYKPIVYRGRPQDIPEDSYLQDTDSSLGSTSRDSSGLVEALSRSNLNQQRKDEGTITFYNNPHFCSDFSGDKMPSNMLSTRDDHPGLVLGIYHENERESMACRLAEACYFTPQFGSPPFRPYQDEKLPELRLAPLSDVRREEIQPIELQVSGLGGVVPEDNFAIEVDIHMSRVVNEGAVIRHVPFTDTPIRANYSCNKYISHRLDLLPPQLPPPSYIFFTSSSSSGNQLDDEDEELFDKSDESSSSADDENPAPPSFLQHWSAEESRGMDGDDDLDDSSVDMLAAARAVDPAKIAEQERQYVINEPGGRAVAGSLAATVGASRSNSSVGDGDSDIPEAGSDTTDDSEMDMDDDDDD